MAVCLQAPPCGLSSPGMAMMAAQFSAGVAIATISLASVIGQAFYKNREEKERMRRRLQEQREAVERERRMMYLCELELRLANSCETMVKQERSRERERQAASEELLEGRRQLTDLRTSLDAAGVPIISVDKSGIVTFWNQKATEVCRCPADNALNNRLTEFLGSGDSTAFSPASIVSSMSGGCPATTCCQKLIRVRSRSAGEVWHELLLHISPQRNAEGRVDGLWCIGQDLTKLNAEKKEAELAAQELTNLISTVNTPIIGVDSSGLVNEWNRKAELLTGYSKLEAVGKDLLKHFIAEDRDSDTVGWMLSQGLRGQAAVDREFSLFTKCGQRLEILMSTSARRDRNGEVVGVIGVGKDITELRSESKMLANYVRICGAAVWSLKGNVHCGSVTVCKTKAIEHLLSQQAQMDICDPRMVLWRASFVSILKTMCQNFWVRRQNFEQKAASTSTSAGNAPQEKSPVNSTMTSSCSEKFRSSSPSPVSLKEPTNEFGYEFCFEAPNGSVKWYKVTGYLIEESLIEGKFEVTGSMQEVTTMWIDKVMSDQGQKWWSRMCHMVFDATLLVDTQEYRVLNAWGEERVFGCKLQSNHPIMPLIKPEDAVSLKEAFNEVTFKGFEKGRTFSLLRKGPDGGSKEISAQCFLLSADQENPNECMMGIRIQASEKKEGDESESDFARVLWDVAKPSQVLTLEDLARLKSGLRRHRRPRASIPHMRAKTVPHRTRSSGPHGSSQSLCSIPEDDHGENSDDDEDDVSASGASVKSDTESLQSSSKSSFGSESGEEMSEEANSQHGSCHSPPRSISEAEIQRMWDGTRSQASNHKKRVSLSSAELEKHRSSKPAKVLAPRTGPALVKLRTAQGSFDLNLDEFSTISALRAQVEELTQVPQGYQTLILAGKRLPLGCEEQEGTWHSIRSAIRPGQTLMLVGSVSKGKADPPQSSEAAADRALAVEGSPSVPPPDDNCAAQPTTTPGNECDTPECPTAASCEIDPPANQATSGRGEAAMVCIETDGAGSVAGCAGSVGAPTADDCASAKAVDCRSPVLSPSGAEGFHAPSSHGRRTVRMSSEDSMVTVLGLDSGTCCEVSAIASAAAEVEVTAADCADSPADCDTSVPEEPHNESGKEALEDNSSQNGS